MNGIELELQVPGLQSVARASGTPAARNAAIGGSPTSRHPAGLALDVPMTRSVTWVKDRRIATHIGWNYSGGNKRVKHIDMGAGGSVNYPIIYKD